jgi:hypothetical protein
MTDKVKKLQRYECETLSGGTDYAPKRDECGPWVYADEAEELLAQRDEELRDLTAAVRILNEQSPVEELREVHESRDAWHTQSCKDAGELREAKGKLDELEGRIDDAESYLPVWEGEEGNGFSGPIDERCKLMWGLYEEREKELREAREENKRRVSKETYDVRDRECDRLAGERDAIAAKLETARVSCVNILAHRKTLEDGHQHLLNDAKAFLEGGE